MFIIRYCFHIVDLDLCIVWNILFVPKASILLLWGMKIIEQDHGEGMKDFFGIMLHIAEPNN